MHAPALITLQPMSEVVPYPRPCGEAQYILCVFAFVWDSPPRCSPSVLADMLTCYVFKATSLRITSGVSIAHLQGRLAAAMDTDRAAP